MQCKLRGAGHCTSAGRMTSVVWHIAEVFPSARQGTILNNHRVIGIATNTSMAQSCVKGALPPDVLENIFVSAFDKICTCLYFK